MKNQSKESNLPTVLSSPAFVSLVPAPAEIEESITQFNQSPVKQCLG
jgi:hypothetical protein